MQRRLHWLRQIYQYNLLKVPIKRKIFLHALFAGIAIAQLSFVFSGFLMKQLHDIFSTTVPDVDVQVALQMKTARLIQEYGVYNGCFAFIVSFLAAYRFFSLYYGPFQRLIREVKEAHKNGLKSPLRVRKQDQIHELIHEINILLEKENESENSSKRET